MSIAYHRGRFRTLHHPWMLPVPDGGEPASHVRGYTKAEMVEMFYRRSRWTATCHWTGDLTSSPEPLLSPTAGGPVAPRASYTLSGIEATTTCNAFTSGYVPPEPHIPDFTGFRTRPGGSMDHFSQGVQVDARVGSCLWGPSIVELEGGAHYYLGGNGAVQYANTSGDYFAPWMTQSGGLYYPQVGILGDIQIYTVAPINPYVEQWPTAHSGQSDPTDPSGFGVAWPAIYRYPWPQLKIIFSHVEVEFGDTLLDPAFGGLGLAKRVSVKGTCDIDGQTSDAYATIFEGAYVDGGVPLGFPLLQYPDDGAENQFHLTAGWAKTVPSWYEYTGTGGRLYDGNTGEVILRDPNGNLLTPVTAPFP